MKFSKLLDSGGMLVGDEVKIKLEIECIKEKKEEGCKIVNESWICNICLRWRTFVM